MPVHGEQKLIPTYKLVEKAIAGYVEKSIAGGAATTALSITDGRYN